MATSALVVAVILHTALAVVLYVLNRRLSAQVALLTEQTAPRNIYAARYVPPQPDDSGTETQTLPDTDVVGAWAYEQELAGVRVTFEEMQMQRQMRAEAGL